MTEIDGPSIAEQCRARDVWRVIPDPLSILYIYLSRRAYIGQGVVERDGQPGVTEHP